MRLTAFGVILALAALLGLCSEQTDAAPRAQPRPAPPPVQPRPIPQPVIIPQPVVLPRPIGGGWGGVRPPNWRPNPNQRPNPGFKMVTLTTNYTVSFNSDSGKVRTVLPPEEFDDKGEIKKHNAEDLKRLKGDDPAEKKLPGYKSEFSELQVNDVVQVAVSSWRTTKAAPKKGKKKDDEDKEDALDRNPKKDAKDGKWVMIGSLYGTVTRIDQANSENSDPKLHIKVQAQVMRPNNAGGNNNNNIDIKSEQAQVTIILIAPRPGSNLGALAGGAPMPGKKKKAPAKDE